MKTVKTIDGRRAAALCVLAAIACGKADDATLESSSSHWLRCDADADCAGHEGAVCGTSGYCVDSSGAPISVAPGAGNSSGETGAAVDTILPAGGVALDSAGLSWVSGMAVDEGGVIWLTGCEGLFAIQGSNVRRYRASDSALAGEEIDQLLVDAQNRLWIFNSARQLQVIADGAVRTVFEGLNGSFKVGRDGSAWVSWREDTELAQTGWIRQVAPDLGEPIQVPSSELTGGLAISDGGVWVGTDTGIYRWSGGAWSGPFGEGPAYLRYDPRQGVLWTDDRRLTWNGSELEEEALFSDDSLQGAELVGFDASGRLIVMDGSILHWIVDGQSEQTMTVAGLATQYRAIGPAGALYLANESIIEKVTDGELSQEAQLSRFDPELDFPWRAQPFGDTLAAPAVDVSASELSDSAAEFFGVKVRIAGIPYGGFETAGVWVGDRSLSSTSVETAFELSSFLSDSAHSISVGIPEEATSLAEALGNEPLRDLYGYMETGSCFGHLSSLRRQFWIVEGYPQDMPAAEREGLAAALRALHPPSPAK